MASEENRCEIALNVLPSVSVNNVMIGCQIGAMDEVGHL
jgi:hypothetical protein